MTAVLYEGLHPGSFILTESERTISRDNVTISGAAIIQPGQVLGQVTATGSFIPYAPGASDGSQNAAAVSIYRYDSTAGDLKGVIIARDAEVIADQLVWPLGIQASDKANAIAALKAAHILVR